MGNLIHPDSQNWSHISEETRQVIVTVVHLKSHKYLSKNSDYDKIWIIEEPGVNFQIFLPNV